jgi:hypothetical protein
MDAVHMYAPNRFALLGSMSKLLFLNSFCKVGKLYALLGTETQCLPLKQTQQSDKKLENTFINYWRRQ